MPSYAKLTPAHIATLRTLLDSERVSTRDADLNLHARDQSFHITPPPEAVIWPETAEEVSRVLRFANEAHIPLTAWGACTSLESNPLAVEGGMVMSLMRINKIVALRA